MLSSFLFLINNEFSNNKNNEYENSNRFSCDKKNGEMKEDEYWKFRARLKNLDMSSKELDSLVHEIYDEVAAQIDCTQCANCCKEISPVMDEKDIAKFAEGLKISLKEFKKRFLVISEELSEEENAVEYEFHSDHCPFLIDNKCSNYDHRPKNCVHYPYLKKKDFSTRLRGVIRNYSLCPIVFNVYEELKLKI